MTKIIVSPSGNHEIWPDAAKPKGYVTPEEWAAAHPLPTPQPPTLDEAHTSKLAEIIAGSNRAAAYLKSFYSEAEESSWPQQEAGARSILKQDANVKDDTAASILRDPVRTEAAVNLVKTLAQIDEVSAESFSSRIVDNAEKAYGAKILTLTEQRGFEHALKDAAATGQVEAVQALVIKYNLPPDGVQL